jgi:hypothetical protein
MSDPPSDAIPPDPSGESCQELPLNMNLEEIVDLTGEMEHLNELIMLRLTQVGGFTGTKDYFAMVHPILDLLEVEIRIRYRPGMNRDEMKRFIRDWIDCEMKALR